MKIVIDRYIPFLEDAVKSLGDVLAIAPDAIAKGVLQDADALIIRTRTRVDERLLKGTNVQFVATATIGYDHLDIDFLRQENIAYFIAEGCNAQGVCDYIEEALNEIAQVKKITTIGIVGHGHIGSKVAHLAKQRGYRFLINDPPKGFCTPLETITQEADVLTFHTPLDNTTYHLADNQLFKHCTKDCFIINAARGGVVDENALLQKKINYIVDCWENEPHINPMVLRHAFLASYHIAGYTLAGKKNASQMCLDALCKHFNLPSHEITTTQGTYGDSERGWLRRISDQLKAFPEDFERLRKEYKLR